MLEWIDANKSPDENIAGAGRVDGGNAASRLRQLAVWLDGGSAATRPGSVPRTATAAAFAEAAAADTVCRHCRAGTDSRPASATPGAAAGADWPERVCGA